MCALFGLKDSLLTTNRLLPNCCFRVQYNCEEKLMFHANVGGVWLATWTIFVYVGLMLFDINSLCITCTKLFGDTINQTITFDYKP